MNHNKDIARAVTKRPENIKRGVIMSVNYGGGTFHLEVVTSAMFHYDLLGYTFGDPVTFNSRGGGRGGGQDGVEKSGGKERSLTDSRVKFFQLVH